jgi:regulator of protease activity HflC (stomatin/prohibitin superfamily)
MMSIFLAAGIITMALLFILIYLFYFRWSTSIPDYMAARHYRFGKPTTEGPISGKRIIIIPSIDQLVLIDRRIQKSNIEGVTLLTKERQRMTLSITIIWKPTDAAKTIENIKPEDIEATFFNIVESAIKNECTKMSVENILENSRTLEKTVKENLQTVADLWGITVGSITISNLSVDNAEFLNNMARPREIELEKAARLAKINEEQTVALKAIEKDKISNMAQLEMERMLDLKKVELEMEVQRLQCEKSVQIENLKQTLIDIVSKNKILEQQADISIETEKIKSAILAETEGLKEKLRVINSFSSNAVNYELVKILPELYKNVGLKDVTLIEGGNGNGHSTGFNFMSNIIGSAYSIMGKLNKDFGKPADKHLFELNEFESAEKKI